MDALETMRAKGYLVADAPPAGLFQVCPGFSVVMSEDGVQLIQGRRDGLYTAEEGLRISLLLAYLLRGGVPEPGVRVTPSRQGPPPRVRRIGW